eukprot:m.356282 g.356282  ORF g.356282 m.356282 type:complete len:206 (+) comp17488_c0_seq1:91-708(+)
MMRSRYLSVLDTNAIRFSCLIVPVACAFVPFVAARTSCAATNNVCTQAGSTTLTSSRTLVSSSAASVDKPVTTSQMAQNNPLDGQLNVLGTALAPCSKDPVTGYYRTGSCQTTERDAGVHVVCAKMTQEFLDFTKARGNDLSTPRPQFGFPGLKPGDQWCLCALRWKEAFAASVAPPVNLQATNEKVLQFVDLEDLKSMQLSGDT